MRKKPHSTAAFSSGLRVDPDAPPQGQGLKRRQILQGGVLGGTGLLAGCASWRDYVPSLGLFGSAEAGGQPAPHAAEAAGHKAAAHPATPAATPAAAADRLTVAAGYKAVPVAAWGDPVGLPGALPAWRPDAGNTAAEQAVQLGMHHGGLQYLPLDGSRRGLLVVAHEGVDDGLLQARGAPGGLAEKVRKAQAAVGLSVVEVALKGDSWQPVRPSRLARRITATTPVAISGPAAGHAALRTAADPSGRRVLGALAGGGITLTPWGTALVGEQGFARAFVTADQPTGLERRYGLNRSGGEAASGTPGKGYRWSEVEDRYDTVRHPNEPNRHGWIVEFDPNDPQAPPVKRTALGRGGHAATAVTQMPNNERVVVYAADGGAFEYLTKFISRDPPRPAERGRSAAQANAGLLDEGTLYVARFNADGTGRWLPMVHGQGPLTPARGFADAAEVLIKARLAADALGATRMDTPEALAAHAASGWVYAAMSRNPLRGAPGQPAVDAANPRPGNALGHLLRWRELPGSAGEMFDWQLLQPGGDAYAQPAALALDPRGGLWMGTGVPSAALGKGELAAFGRNQLLRCAGVGKSQAGMIHAQRLLSAPVNAEIGGLAFTPDGRTLFVNIAHPGETPGAASDPNAPNRLSNWPDFRPDGRPRSATVALRREDGGSVGG